MLNHIATRIDHASQRAFFFQRAMFNRHIVFGALTLLLLVLAACAPPPASAPSPTAAPPAELILATTTSTYDSGLLDYILPDFESKTGIRVRVIAVGTGQALALGKAGDADVLLVHARQREEQFVAEGYAPFRKDVMYNDFVIIGPPADPAGIRGMTSAAEALSKIAEKKALFISRGDDSGTHIKEQGLWQMAGITPEGDWYESAGQGMGAVLNMANEQQAYTLSDRSTYLVRRNEGLDLEIMVEGDPPLFNQYGVLPVSSTKHPGINYDGAIAFIDWITSADTQKLIASYGLEKFGTQLFFPNAQ